MRTLEHRSTEQKAELATKALKILQKHARSTDTQFSLKGVLRDAGLSNAEVCASYEILKSLDLVVKVGPKVKGQYRWDVDQKSDLVSTSDVKLVMASVKAKVQARQQADRRLSTIEGLKQPLETETVLVETQDPLGVIDQLVTVIKQLEERIETLELVNRTLTNGSDEAREIISRYS